MDNATKLQAVINTIPLLNIQATFENVNHLTGIYKILCEVRDDLEQEETAEISDEIEEE